MVDRIRWDTVSYLPFYYVFFQFLLLTIFNLQANSYIDDKGHTLKPGKCPHGSPGHFGLIVCSYSLTYVSSPDLLKW